MVTEGDALAEALGEGDALTDTETTGLGDVDTTVIVRGFCRAKEQDARALANTTIEITSTSFFTVDPHHLGEAIQLPRIGSPLPRC